MSGSIKVGGNTIATHTGAQGAGEVTLGTNLRLPASGGIQDSSGNSVLTESGGNVSLGNLRLPASGGIKDSSGNNVLSESGGLVTIADTVQHVIPMVNANRSADQTGISAGAFTKVLFNNEVTDTHNFFDASSSYRFQPTIAGYYIINTAVSFTTTAGTRFITSLFKNLGEYIRLLDVITTADAIRIPVSSIIQLNGSSDFIEIYGYADTPNALSFSSYSQGTFFNAFLLQRT